MERITPTGWGKQTGTPVRQLGSLRAVLEKMPDGGAVVIASIAQAREVETTLRELGLDRHYFTIITAAGGPDPLFRIPRHFVIGVAPDAFAGIPTAMWADIQKVLTIRFPTVLWG